MITRNAPYCYIYLPLKEAFSINFLIGVEVLLRGLKLLCILTGVVKVAETPIFTGISRYRKGQKSVTIGEICVGKRVKLCGYQVKDGSNHAEGEKVCNNGYTFIYNIWGKFM